MSSFGRYLSLFLAIFCVTTYAQADSSLPKTGLSKSQYKMIQLATTNNPFRDGPNCFNASLRFSGVVSVFRFLDGEEFNFWLSSPLCRALDASESIRPGDIRAIFQRTGSDGRAFPYHAQVYLSEAEIFEKSGMSKDHPYQVIAAPAAGRLFSEGKVERSDKCSRATGSPPECFSWVNIYRCRDYSTLGESNSSASKFDSVLIEIERRLESVTFRSRDGDGQTSFSEVDSSYKKLLKALDLTIEDVVAVNDRAINNVYARLNLKRSDGNDFAVRTFIYRMRGIDFQLMNIKYPQNDSRPPTGLEL